MKADFYICPSCRSPIPLDDINVPKDLALCRNCGKTSAFSSLCRLDSAEIEPPKRVHTETDFFDGSVKITCRYLSLPFLLFFIPFMVFWSGFSIYNIYGRQLMKGNFDPMLSLFGLPFALGTIVMIGAIVFIAAGKTTITLRRGEGSIFTGVGSLGRRRNFTCGIGTIVRIEQTTVQVNGRNKDCIIIQNGKDICRFGTLLSKPNLQYIHSQILRQCFPR